MIDPRYFGPHRLGKGPYHYIANPFTGLVVDAIAFALQAQEADPDSDDAGRCARASIVHSVFSVEAAANSCLEHLSISHKLRDVVERLPTLDKFEFSASLWKPGAAFDRGCRSVQAIAELVDLRNGYVHPRKTRKSAEQSAADSGTYTFNVAATTTGQLRWSRDRLHWNATQAREALRVCLDFLEYYFRQLLQLDEARCDHLLADSFEDGQFSFTLRTSSWNSVFRRARVELGCDFSTLGIAPPGAVSNEAHG
jgi:hypothetical protein